MWSAFWPSKLPSKEEALLTIVKAWTKQYVGQKLADTMTGLAEGDLMAANDSLKLYKDHQEKLVKHAAEEEKKIFGKFPMDDWIPAQQQLNSAMGAADMARTKLEPGNSKHTNETKVAGIPTYLSAVALSMTL